MRFNEVSAGGGIRNFETLGADDSGIVPAFEWTVDDESAVWADPDRAETNSPIYFPPTNPNIDPDTGLAIAVATNDPGNVDGETTEENNDDEDDEDETSDENILSFDDLEDDEVTDENYETGNEQPANGFEETIDDVITDSTGESDGTSAEAAPNLLIDGAKAVAGYTGDVLKAVIQEFTTDLEETVLHPAGAVADILDAVFGPVTGFVGEKLADGLDWTLETSQLGTKIGDSKIANYLKAVGAQVGENLTTDFFNTLLDPAGAMYEIIGSALDPITGPIEDHTRAYINAYILSPLLDGIPANIRDSRFGTIIENIVGDTIDAVWDNVSGEKGIQNFKAGSFLGELAAKTDILQSALGSSWDETKLLLNDTWEWANTNLEDAYLNDTGSGGGNEIILTENPAGDGVTDEEISTGGGNPADTNNPGNEMGNNDNDDTNDDDESDNNGENDMSFIDYGDGLGGDTSGDGSTNGDGTGNDDGTGNGDGTTNTGNPQPTLIPDAKTGLTKVDVDQEGLNTSTDNTQTLKDLTKVTTGGVGPVTTPAAVGGGAAGTADAAGTLKTQTVTAVEAGTATDVTAAQGTVSDAAVAKADAGTLSEGSLATVSDRDATAEAGAMADVNEYAISTESYVDKVTGAKVEVAATPDAEAKQRNAITDDTYAEGEATEIINTIGYEASQRRAVTGSAATGAAVEMLAEVGDIPPAIAASLVEDPASVQAQLDEAPVEVVAAIAALPKEALMSSQIENLLGSMEEGKTPVWARPAVDKVNAMMAARGLDASTVGRDSLFNAIIQSAMPIAQDNAKALQDRAAQNLDNQQQANVTTAQLDMQRRLQNVQNRQTAASQTAQMANDMKVLQSKFNQEANITTANQGQQMRLSNLENRQRSAELNAQNEQQMRSLNLSNEQQMELANLEIQAQTDKDNMSAVNQEKLAEYQVAAEFLSKNAELKQSMDIANMSNEQQMKLANLQARNDASSDNLNAAQQTELANMQKDLNTRLKSADIASSMGVAQLNADQQRAITNATMVANVDMSKFNAEQQVELANSKFMQTMTAKDFDAANTAILQNATAMASMDIANVDQRTKLAITNAQSFLAMDVNNLNNKQQVVVLKSQQEQQRLLSDQSAKNAANQFNATSQNQAEQFMKQLGAQINQFNVASADAMKQFNAGETNKMAAVKSNNDLNAKIADAQVKADIGKFNANIQNSRDQWNAANIQAIEQSNIAWRRTANTADTAALNAANTQNVQNAYNMSSIELSQMWQQQRDDATFRHNSKENYNNRVVQLYGLAIGSEAAAGNVGSTSTGDLINHVTGILDGGNNN